MVAVAFTGEGIVRNVWKFLGKVVASPGPRG
jgi:hypothetical protein